VEARDARAVAQADRELRRDQRIANRHPGDAIDVAADIRAVARRVQAGDLGGAIIRSEDEEQKNAARDHKAHSDNLLEATMSPPIAGPAQPPSRGCTKRLASI